MEKDYTKIRIAILIVSATLLTVLPVRSRRGPPPIESGLPDPVMIEVLGDVSNPGIYLLSGATATVACAAAKAGCGRNIAPPLAQLKLISGQSIEVLSQGEEVLVKFGRMPGAALLACGLKLDLNSASFDELLLIPHMRAEIAASIINRRHEARWEKVEDLKEIRGVGQKTTQKLKDYLETL